MVTYVNPDLIAKVAEALDEDYKSRNKDIARIIRLAHHDLARIAVAAASAWYAEQIRADETHWQASANDYDYDKGVMYGLSRAAWLVETESGLA